MKSPSENDNKGYVLYLGSYLDRDIVAERALPTYNAAGANHIIRIAGALRSAGQRVLVVSSAVSMRMRWQGRIFHRSRAGTAGSAPVVFSAAVGLPVIGMCLEPLFMFLALRSMRRRRNVTAAIIVNFSPAMLLIALWIKLSWRIRLIHNIEDVSVPKWRDWLPGSPARPVQQLVFWACMLGITRLSDKVIIPTRLFADILPRDKQWLVIAGCMPVSVQKQEAPPARDEKFPIRILYSCNMEFEYGIGYVLRAMEKLSADEFVSGAFHIDVCGHNPKAEMFIKRLAESGKLDMAYHGFLADEEYKNLLSKSDICMELRDPFGRFASHKTPSKVYEYLASGKMVITTAMGDLPWLPADVITICHPLGEDGLCKELKAVLREPGRARRQGEKAMRYAEEYFSYEIVGPAIRDFITGPL